jgi:hypothetical protein
LRIHKGAAAALLSVAVAGSLVAASGAPALAGTRAKPASITGFGVVTVTPSKNLVNGQIVKVAASKFTGATKLYAAECSALAVKNVSEDYCDTTMADLKVVPASKGGATFSFKILTGSSMHPTKGPSCAWPQTCYLVVANGPTLATTTIVAFPKINFKDPRPLTKTKVSAKKKVTAHKAVLIRAATTHKGTAALSGKVTFFDNGKKIGAVKEKASGKVSLKHKFKKAGKQHIVAKYSGNKSYQPSHGKATVTVKK